MTLLYRWWVKVELVVNGYWWTVINSDVMMKGKYIWSWVEVRMLPLAIAASVQQF